jgi:hypothetical protein
LVRCARVKSETSHPRWLKDGVPGFTLDEARIIKSNSVISHDKSTREMGFQPRPMKETAADSIAWFRQNGRL